MARGKGEGSITESNGMYQARITIGYDANGKQKRQAKYFKTKREAKEWLTEVKSTQDKGTYIEPNKITVGEWLDIWLEEYKKRQVRMSTYSRLRNDIAAYIKPVLGKHTLQGLRVEMVQKFINDLSDRGLSRASVESILFALSGGLKQAVDNELITKNVANKIILPIKDTKERRVLTAEEQKRFIEAAKEQPDGDLYILILATGMRIGEALVLTWGDIDFETGLLNISNSHLALSKESKRISKEKAIHRTNKKNSR